MLDELFEVALRCLEGLLEGTRDLAVGFADQAFQLRQGALQVGTLLRELLDVLERLAILALGERVHGTQRLASPRKPLELSLDLLALRGLDRRGRRLKLSPQGPPHPLELGGCLVAAVAQVSRLYLGCRQRLAGLVEPCLQARFRLRAFPELRGEVLRVAAVEHPPSSACERSPTASRAAAPASSSASMRSRMTAATSMPTSSESWRRLPSRPSTRRAPLAARWAAS